MKTKNLIIIFILFLAIALAGATTFLNSLEKRPVLSQADAIINSGDQSPVAEIESGEIGGEVVLEAGPEIKPVVRPEKTVLPEIGGGQAEQTQAVLRIDGAEFRTSLKPGVSAYELMDKLRQEKKIDFQGKDYASLGFFVEQINGIRNNPGGKNWVYYVNGRPAPVGVSNYRVKANDVIEWKYEKKMF